MPRTPVNLVEAVERGISATYEFIDPSIPEPIPYRAITRWEHENAHAMALEGCYNENIVKALVGLGWKTEENLDLTIEEYKELRHYMFEVMLWICYHGLKDYQPGDFSVETLRDSFIDVKELSTRILEVSVAKKEEIIEVLKNARGTELAYIIHVLKVPLVDEAWKFTPLQFEFSIFSRRHLENRAGEKGVKLTKEMWEKDPEKYKQVLKAMFRGSGSR